METTVDNIKFSSDVVLGRLSVSASELIECYPPRYRNRYKAAKWREVMNQIQAGKSLQSDSLIAISQYRGAFDDIAIAKIGEVEIAQVDYFFDYKPSDDATTQWYLNFADPHLFVAYESNLFAQDEIQCLEHPLLGSIREYLSASKGSISTLTITRGYPTPILIENVPYMIEVDTRIAHGDHEYSIYGNDFHFYEMREPAILDRAIKIRDVFSESNIIVMCAPLPDYGKYRRDTIEYMLACAIVSFWAARDRSATDRTEIHTGRWGAGAFGGDEELALLVQIIAARLAGVAKLTFHAVSSTALGEAIRFSDQMLAEDHATLSLAAIVDRIMARGYTWGFSDGN